MAPKVFSWTGFYIGGQAGLAAGDTEGNSTNLGAFINSNSQTELNLDGGIYGGHVGYNYQTGNFVIGIEGTYSGSNVEANGQTPFLVPVIIPPFNVHQELEWLATLEARLGYAFGRSMVYARGGWAWGKLDTELDWSLFPGAPFNKGSETHNGWTAGFGLEHAFGDWLTARVEYSHVDLDTENHQLTCSGCAIIPDIAIRNEAQLDIVRVGVSLKFGG